VCGICGKLIFDESARVSTTLVKAMADNIWHRGPDDEGFYVAGQIGLGFRRLSIIDLSGGHQPLSNEDGTVWIAFNGEIYNYQQLRQFLLGKGHVFRTQSDTEVIVHLYEELGEACVEKLRGMFAFAIWDSRQKALFLARDRVGIKPLYYHLSQNALLFGSEIKAILADPEVKPEVDPNMIDRLLTFDYIPGEETLFRNIRKLAPGTSMMVKAGRAQIRQYWDLNFTRSSLSLAQAEAQLEALLEESVKLHMISDVPVGFLLSGGLDSTAMLGFAVGKTDRPLSSFTIGFSHPGVTDERPYARIAAQKYGVEQHEMTISADDFASFLPNYIWYMEEPICEPPAVALYYISKLARDFVKVLISGEGGDEAFAGYPNYRNMLWLERLKAAAGPFDGALAAGLKLAGRLLRSEHANRYGQLMGTPFENYYYSRTSSPFRYFNRQADQLYTQDFAASVDKNRSLGVVRRLLENSANIGIHGDRVNQMLYVDTKTWLAEDLLLKADKMTMANSVELRVPLLDHELLEFAASLPGNYKVRGFTTKYIAKKVLSQKVPREILERKKIGFPVPYETWLRTDLRDWVRDILLDGKTLGRGYFKKECIELLLSGNQQRGSHSKEIFTLTMLELWHREFLEKRSAISSRPSSNATAEAEHSLVDASAASGRP
jgi:asparagine synthase (glutamine-hydrolysing)